MDYIVLLNQLEEKHACIAKAIISLRDLRDNQDKYTAQAIADMEGQVKVDVGAGQKIMDGITDYRSFVAE